MNSQEPHQTRSQDTHPITGDDSFGSNEIAFLVGEDGQLHSLQDETHKDWNPENRLVQKNGIQSNRNECHILTTTNSCQQHYQNNDLQQNSDDMVCNICGKKYKYMSSFWKHRRDHETKGEFVAAFSSIPNAASKSIRGMLFSSAPSIKALISQKLFDRSGKLCPQSEINPESEFKPIMMKMEKASPANYHLQQFDFCSYRNQSLSDSWQEKFHNKGCSSVAIRPSVLKTEEAVPYCIMGKVSPPSNFNITSRDHLPAFQCRPLPDYFFSCDICGKKYKYKSSFLKHIEDHKNFG
ncbi:uncharacterized protein LOC109935977 [Rhincodon typus]|uniref:uncharacterized protein LOC109935977 n=1 Tax=Rhincodon typus TaxID=259920 RepID=UPI00202F8607|nr:uncharacterized protein LOC109935977 [Rhincodon typus]